MARERERECVWGASVVMERCNFLKQMMRSRQVGALVYNVEPNTHKKHLG